MCGRTSLAATRAELEARFDASVAGEWSPRYNLSPGGDYPVILDRTPDTIESIQWGFIPSWATEASIGDRMINARAETVDERRSFARAFRERRCLVVADGFYEWAQIPGGTQPYHIVRADGDPFAMAGIWNPWEGTEEPIRSFAVLTTDPNTVMRPIHERMPVLFEPNEELEWLSAPPSAAKRLLDPIDPDSIRAYPVSSRVNDPRNDDPGLIEPVTPFDQRRLDEFRT